MTSRRSPLAVGLALTLMLIAAGPSSAAEPIKIGYLGPLTGIFAQSGITVP